MNDAQEQVDAALTWTAKIGERNGGREAKVPWWVNDKLRLHEFCVENGFPRPKVFGSWTRPDDVPFDQLPERFVLKPSNMFSMWGVLMLTRLEDGSYFDHLKKRTLSVKSIIEIQQRAYERCAYKSKFQLMAEELVSSGDPKSPIPFDYKVAVFYDEPGQVLQINRNVQPIQNAFFDGRFEPLDLESSIESDWKGRGQGGHVRPDSWREILEISVDITRKLATPFMRVDILVGSRGPVVGELTPSPGDAFYGNNYRFTKEYDLMLGSAWRAAEERLGLLN